MNEKETYDVSKLKFDIDVAYDCDEGEGCSECLNAGTYEEAVGLFTELESNTWIDCYYHYMSISMSVRDENGDELDLEQVLDGDYGWVKHYGSVNKTTASETPRKYLQFLKDLKGGSDGKKTREIAELENRVKKLEEELEDAKKELAGLKGE